MCLIMTAAKVRIFGGVARKAARNWRKESWKGRDAGVDFEFRPGLRLDCARRLRCSIMKVLAVSLALALCVPCAALTVGTLARPRAFPRRCSSPQANMFDVTNAAPILIDFTNTAPVLTLLAKSGMDNAVDDLLRIFPLVFLVRRSLRTFLTTPSARPALSCCSHCRPRRALHAHARREGLP